MAAFIIISKKKIKVNKQNLINTNFIEVIRIDKPENKTNFKENQVNVHI